MQVYSRDQSAVEAATQYVAPDGRRTRENGPSTCTRYVPAVSRQHHPPVFAHGGREPDDTVLLLGRFYSTGGLGGRLRRAPPRIPRRLRRESHDQSPRAPLRRRQGSLASKPGKNALQLHESAEKDTAFRPHRAFREFSAAVGGEAQGETHGRLPVNDGADAGTVNNQEGCPTRQSRKYYP